jgi:hypothetical protein
MLSSCTLENNLAVHGFGALLFFYGSVLYYILTDWSLSAVGQPPPILSRILSWSLIPLLVAYMKLIGKSFERGPDWVLYATLGAVFQYITALLIFVKIFLFAFDVPEHYGAVIFADSSQ